MSCPLKMPTLRFDRTLSAKVSGFRASLLSAVEAWFDLDEDKANAAVLADDEIDHIDVEIERASVPLLAMGETDHARIRSVDGGQAQQRVGADRGLWSNIARLCCTIEMIWIVPQIPPFV